MQTMTIPLAEGMYRQTTVEWRIQELVRRLNAVVLIANSERDYQSDTTYYSDKPGPNFTRIVRDQGNQRFVECFVENATGLVVKSAGWKSPAKEKGGFAYRYNLMDTMSRLHYYRSLTALGGSYYKEQAFLNAPVVEEVTLVG